MINNLKDIIKKEKWLIGLVVVLGVLLLGAYWLSTHDFDRETGGTGGYDKNTVTILGWEKTAGETELGAIISLEQYDQLAKEISQKIAQKHGEFDYEEAEIEDGIENIYDKKSATDQTIFYVKMKNFSDRLKVTLNHNSNTAEVE